MGCVRRGKKQKQGARTLSKEEAVGRERPPSRVLLDENPNLSREDWDKAMARRPLIHAVATLGALAVPAPSLNEMRRLLEHEGR